MRDAGRVSALASDSPDRPARSRRRQVALWVSAAALPLAAAAFLLGVPDADARWENHPIHFWLVLGAALVSTALGYTIRQSAIRRRDARLFLISLSFIASAGFLGLHALATPGVLVEGANTGFVIATPVGLLVGGVFAALSSLELRTAAAAAVMRRAGLLTSVLFAAMAVWAALSVAEVRPLSPVLDADEARGPLVAVAAAGVLLYAAAAFGYLRLYRRRNAQLVFALGFSFALLAEALVVVVAALSTSWRLSWWEWHLLLVLGFAFAAYSAHREWHEERFSTLYLEETLAGVKEASILFADLQAFTSFSERTDPLAVREMLQGYFDRLVPLLEELGGEVHQLIGDAIMVIYTGGGKHPDHALVACRSALALQREATAIADAHPDWPRFRVGVNSGEVAAGVVGGRSGHRKHGVVGDTVNLAARLEGQAAAGEVVIGAGTYAALPAGTVVERLPELQVKGKAAPVEAYVLRSLGDDRPASGPATSTP